MNIPIIKKPIYIGVFLLLALNLLLNVWIYCFNSFIPFSSQYWGNHHYYKDERVDGGSFNLLRAWGQTDSQWYLKLAAEGYGTDIVLNRSDEKMGGMGYAFFPLYPIAIRFFSLAADGNFELGALFLVIC